MTPSCGTSAPVFSHESAPLSLYETVSRKSRSRAGLSATASVRGCHISHSLTTTGFKWEAAWARSLGGTDDAAATTSSTEVSAPGTSFANFVAGLFGHHVSSMDHPVSPKPCKYSTWPPSDMDGDKTLMPKLYWAFTSSVILPSPSILSNWLCMPANSPRLSFGSFPASPRTFSNFLSKRLLIHCLYKGAESNSFCSSKSSVP
mmetsp:Transcript_78635/g.211105  ORF Transcript_78635/g.211105 Transcript_78635/m.211105 type:complete len:203 (+) Transcript_78635:637-1245(+)